MAFFELTANKIKSTLNDIIIEPTLTLYFGKGAHIEGHKGVLSFSSEEIIFRKSKGLIILVGKNLTITELTKTDAYIKGDVLEIKGDGQNE